MYAKIPQLLIFACTVHQLAGGYKSQTMAVVLCPPSCSVVYNAVGSGPAEVECTHWKKEWLAKNCTRVKCWLSVRVELSYKSIYILSLLWDEIDVEQLVMHGARKRSINNPDT